jgi:hypothetical protein
MAQQTSVGDHDRSLAPLLFSLLVGLVLGTWLVVRFPFISSAMAGVMITYWGFRLARWWVDRCAVPPPEAVRGPISREEIQRARAKLRSRARR